MSPIRERNDVLSSVATPRPSNLIALTGTRTAYSDARWPEIVAALKALRAARRHAVRIVDADCACGALLIATLRQARMLGFTAIEGRGIDGAPAMIGRARAAATRLRDPAIGVEFDLADVEDALASEADFPADIVLWHGDALADHRHGLARALAAAGDVVIAGPARHRFGDCAA
jgi:SAM-dependent methyltransferase